jgi:hypothetical protein
LQCKSIFLICFILIFQISCNKHINKSHLDKDTNFKVTVLVGLNYTKFCIVPFAINSFNQSKTCVKDEHIIDFLCNTIITENSLFKLPVREAADIIIKGLSEIQLKNPIVGRNIKKVIVASIENEQQLDLPEAKNFPKDLENILLKNKVPALVKKLEKDEITSLFRESSFKDFPKNEDSFFYLYTGENIFHLIKFKESKPISVFREDLGSHQIFSDGEKFRKEFFYCRQPISEFFQNVHSGWENFEDCRSYIKDRFSENKNYKKLEEMKDPESKLYVLGSIWSEMNIYFKSNKISREQIKLSVRQNCKESTINLLNKKNSKEISYKLCFNMSYIDTILSSLNLKEAEILRENNLTDSLALFSGIFPECNPSPINIERKK